MASPSEGLSELLTELKKRSGHSYERIGRKVNAGKSTVQRYCAGHSIPPEFGTIERIARACGANSDEIARLFLLWERATSTSTSASTEAAVRSPGHIQEQPKAVDGVESPPTLDIPAHVLATMNRSTARPAGRRRWRRRGAAAIVAGTLVPLVAVLAITKDGPPPQRPPAQKVQWIAGPTWERPAQPVPSTLFGVTINSATGTMPAFLVGAARLWDSGTQWVNIEPSRGEFDWTVLDREISGAHDAGLPLLFTFGGTPGWASPAGPVGPYPEQPRTTPPDDLVDWDTFVSALVGRYHGRIEAYEMWALANDPRFYTGSAETLVDMTRRAGDIIRAADPRATIVCPGMGNLETPAGREMLARFAALGGYGYCDVAGIKLYQRVASDPPETMLDLAIEADRVFHHAGLQPRLWSTGTMYQIRLQKELPEAQARNYAVRFFLVGIYARYLNLERMYFYNWGGTKIPIVLQAVGGAPTQAALAVEQLQRWLAHAQSRSCGHGLAINLPDNVWQCQFTINEPGRRHDATIRWTQTGTAATTAGPGMRTIRRLDGATTAVEPGDTITVGEEPILIESDA
jgi:hypothetical protein